MNAVNPNMEGLDPASRFIEVNITPPSRPAPQERPSPQEGRGDPEDASRTDPPERQREPPQPDHHRRRHHVPGRASLYPTEVLVRAPECGLTTDSVVLLNQVRSIDTQRIVRRLGKLRSETMVRVDRALLRSFGLLDL